jgi:hypothetical protein
MDILGTTSVPGYIAPDRVDPAAPVSQVMPAGFGGTGTGVVWTEVSVAAFNIAFPASMVVCAGMAARLAMLADGTACYPAGGAS